MDLKSDVLTLQNQCPKVNPSVSKISLPLQKLRATALRVDNVKDRERELAQKEQMLRKMKENMKKEKKLPEGVIKDVLLGALQGKDIMKKEDHKQTHERRFAQEK